MANELVGSRGNASPVAKEQALVGHDEEVQKTGMEDQPAVREFDPAFVRRTMRKLDWGILPLLTLIYLTSSLDKSNLGNAKTLGLIPDIGKDATGSRYALLNSMYFISYAPFMVPFALLGKRTRMNLVLTGCAVLWGIAATAFAGVHNFSGAFACRFFIGLGEAGFSPLIQVFLSRFYTREKLGIRVAFWLAMAPLAGFFNGIIAYGVAFIHSHLESWRILFLIEGSATVVIAVIALIVIPNDIPSCRWLNEEEKDFLMYQRFLSMGPETKDINWKHAVGCLWRWQQLLPIFMNMCQQITGAALSAFLPTLTSENGFKGATAQVATLAPYGAAAVCMVIASWFSDRFRNRGWPTVVGWVFCILGFAMYVGVDVNNKGAHFAGLIFGEVGHYICTPLLVTWQANNAGSESRRAVAVPLQVACAQAVAIGSGYLFPKIEGPRYIKGNSVEAGLSTVGLILTLVYMILVKRENTRRNVLEGSPEEGFRPDTSTYADDAPGFRYIG